MLATGTPRCGPRTQPHGGATMPFLSTVPIRPSAPARRAFPGHGFGYAPHNGWAQRPVRSAWLSLVAQAMMTPAASEADAVPVPGGRTVQGGGAAPADREGRKVEAAVLAVIFAGAAAEVVALCALLW
jgi:hypothetical protein